MLEDGQSMYNVYIRMIRGLSMMVRDCIGNMWGWDGGSQAILFDGFGWKEGFRVMAMVRDLSGTCFSRIS